MKPTELEAIVLKAIISQDYPYTLAPDTIGRPVCIENVLRDNLDLVLAGIVPEVLYAVLDSLNDKHWVTVDYSSDRICSITQDGYNSYVSRL